MGFSTPDDAMTPASMLPVPPPAPKIHAQILKKPVEKKLRKTPPGPPCIPPPEYDDYGEFPLKRVPLNASKKHVPVVAAVQNDIEDNYEPVESKHLREWICLLYCIYFSTTGNSQW